MLILIQVTDNQGEMPKILHVKLLYLIPEILFFNDILSTITMTPPHGLGANSSFVSLRNHSIHKLIYVMK